MCCAVVCCAVLCCAVLYHACWRPIPFPRQPAHLVASQRMAHQTARTAARAAGGESHTPPPSATAAAAAAAAATTTAAAAASVHFCSSLQRHTLLEPFHALALQLLLQQASTCLNTCNASCVVVNAADCVAGCVAQSTARASTARHMLATIRM
jgi:hypothetical protein